MIIEKCIHTHTVFTCTCNVMVGLQQVDWQLRASFFTAVTSLAGYIGWQSTYILQPLLQQVPLCVSLSTVPLSLEQVLSRVRETVFNLTMSSTIEGGCSHLNLMAMFPRIRRGFLGGRVFTGAHTCSLPTACSMTGGSQKV